MSGYYVLPNWLADKLCPGLEVELPAGIELAREHYVAGLIELDEFERLVERALRAERRKPALPLRPSPMQSSWL